MDKRTRSAGAGRKRDKSALVPARSSGALQGTVTLSALRAFVAVVEFGSFSSAAQALGVTQPNVSVQLATLEESCGVLLVRRRPAIALTEPGQDLFVRARLVLSRVQEFEAAASDAQHSASGRLSIGISTPHVAMPIIAQFMHSSSGVRVTTSMGNTTTLLEDVAKCRVDVAITSLIEPVGQFACALVAAPRLTVCMRADDPLAKRSALSVRELANRPFVMREDGSQTRQILEATFADAKIGLKTSVVLATREAMKEAIAAGLGLGALFEGENGLDTRFACVPFRSIPVTSGVYVVALKESIGIPTVRAFLDHIAKSRT